MAAGKTAWPWDVDIDTTRVGLERCMRALLVTGSTLTDSRLPRYPPGRGVTALLRVYVPAGEDARFRDVCRPIVMRPPPQVSLGCNPPPDDGHPGRHRLARIDLYRDPRGRIVCWRCVVRYDIDESELTATPSDGRPCHRCEAGGEGV